jgi:hypothetical protein
VAVLLRSADTGTQTVVLPPAGAASGEGGQGPVLEWISVARCPRKVAGMPAYLLSPGRGGGLLGAGRIRYGPFWGTRDGQPGTVAHHLLVEWSTRLPFAGRLPLEVLAAEVPSFNWTGVHGDLVTMPGDTEGPLARIWSQWAPDLTARDAVRRFRHPRPRGSGGLPLVSGRYPAGGGVAPRR